MNPKMVTLEQLQSEGTILLGRIRDFMDSGVDTLELEISDKFDGAYVDGGYLILCKGSQKLQLGPFASGDSDLPEVTIADNGKVLKVVNGVWAKGIDATGGGESYDDTELRGRISAIENKESGWNAKYIKPNGGIPKTDLASAVQSSLNKADNALQSVPNTYRTASAQDVIDSGKLSDAPSDGKQYARKNGAWTEVISGGGGTSDHRQLTHRNDADQHSISAITGLQSALNGKLDASEIKLDPNSRVYKIGTSSIAAEFDGNGAIISSVYAKKTELDNYAKKNDFVDEEQIIVPAYTNLVDTAGYTDGKLLRSDGAENDSASQFVTGFIPVTKGDVIRFKPHNNIDTNSSVIVFYDANKTITSGIGKTFSSIMGNATYGAPTITDNTFTINTANIGYYFWQNIAFVRFCAKGGGAGAIVTVNEEISGSATETKYTLKEEIKVTEENLDFEFPPMLKGRNIVCFGDSILALIRNETGVLAQAAKMTGGNFINCGFGGCRMSAHPESKYDAFSFYQLATAVATNNFSDQDVAATASGAPDYYPEQLARLKAVNWNEVDEIIVAYGTNDYDANVVIDGSANNTIIGAMKNGLSAILTAYPHLKVNIASTIFRMWGNVGSDVHTNSNGNKLTDVNNALKKVAAERKANFIDLYNTCGITTDNASTMLSDGTHPSVIGCRIIGRAYGGGIIKPTSAKTALKSDLDDKQDKALIVNITQSGGVFSADKTNAEIYAAAQANNIVIAIITVSGSRMPLLSATSTKAVFADTMRTQDVHNGTLTIKNNVVTAVDTELQSTKISDDAGYFTADTVEGALAEIGGTLDGLENAINTIRGVS